MRTWKRRAVGAGWLLAAVLGWTSARAQTTAVQDTVTDASGAPASGTVVVSWGAFTTAAGISVPAGSLSTTLGTGGVLSVSLEPNAGATPMGSYYTAVYHLSDGTVSREFWVVPVAVPGGGPAKLAGIRNQVLPTSVAMQTVSKQYVDTTVARAVATASISGTAGGDLSGSFPGPAVTAVHATTGTLDGVTIGGTTAAAGSFNMLSVVSAGSLAATLATASTVQYPIVVTGFAPNLPSGGEVAISPGISPQAGQFGWFGLHNTGTPANNYVVIGLGGSANDLALYAGGKVLGVRNIFDDGSGNGTDAGKRTAASFHETLNTPASSTALCTTGDFTDDANFHYVCVSANSWKRVALSSF